MISLPFRRSHSDILKGARIFLRAPHLSDYKMWHRQRVESRDFLTPWEPTWNDYDLEKTGFRQRIQRYDEDRAADHSYAFFIFRASDRQLVGGITIGNIRRGVGQSGMIGYWSGVRFAGQGYMTEALEQVIPFAFNKLGLHRLEAACIPHNVRSIRLLEKAGFQREGLLRSYLKINGMWQDHLLFSLLESDRYI